MFKKLTNFIGKIYFHPIFYYIWAIIVLILFVGYWNRFLFVLGKYVFIAFAAASFFDFVFLFMGGSISAKRKLPEKLSNGDQNAILIDLKSNFSLPIHINIIDELPKQFQKRDFGLYFILKPQQQLIKKYLLRPVKRGIYQFGKLNIFISSPIKLAMLRLQFSDNKEVSVYPSFVQMHKYELIALANKAQLGVKRVRRLGHTMEFEQIKEYSKGDDYRTINWKATAKHTKLMVNQYQDEKSQNIYSIIDMGRTMKMPFNGMTLLDYAINSTLTFSNIVMKKKDKAGLISFEKYIHSYIKPDSNRQHLQNIFESLYAIDTQFNESDFERLYTFVRHRIPTRSMLMLYTNFEHINSMRRQLPFLIKLSKKHLLVVIIFENTELRKLLNTQPVDNQSLYHKIVATDFDIQKKMMVKELNVYNIQSILTSPQNLTTATINKYLQLKARGLI